MKRASIAFSFLLISVGLPAQVALQPEVSFGVAHVEGMDSSASPVTPWSTVSGCPVALRAEQVPSGNMMQVRKEQHDQPQQPGQRLHLIFAKRDSKQITAATVVARGFTFAPGPIMTAANAVRKFGQDGSRWAARTIEIAFGPQTGTSVSANILVPGVTATQTIDLVALTYADGTSWKLAEGQACRITPDPFMLVAGR